MLSLDTNEKFSFGSELKDGFTITNSWVAHGIQWLEDIQNFYRERSSIEKEYTGKLNALAKKYHDKKGRKSTILSVGDSPSVTPGSLENSSLGVWESQLITLEQVANEREQFSTRLITELAEPLKFLQGRYDDLRKIHAEYASKLERDRDSTYGELKKAKTKYDAACLEVENRRKKLDHATESTKAKAQAAFNQQLIEMENAKNAYLICISVTNKLKDRYYHVNVPELLDSLQELSEARTLSLNNIWKQAARFESEVSTRIAELENKQILDIPRNDPRLESTMFIQHNQANWKDPSDFQFEPSPVWHDDAVISSSESAKTFLQNMLTKSKRQLKELHVDAETRRSEIEQAKKVCQDVREGKDPRDEVEVVRAIFILRGSLNEINRSMAAADTEIETILQTVGDVSLGARNHHFKSETFKIPTNCDYCGERIWGLSAKGFNCKDCGFTCHSKCQMKCPADCPGEQSKEEKKRLKAARQEAAHLLPNVTNSSTSPSARTTVGSPDKVVENGNILGRHSTISMLNTLSSGYFSSPQRSTASTQRSDASNIKLNDAKPDNWRDSKTLSGSVTIGEDQIDKSQSLAPALAASLAAKSSRNAKSSEVERCGKMLYAYEAASPNEITVSEDDIVTILEPDDGSGWMVVRCNNQEGNVPASYVSIISEGEGKLCESAAKLSLNSITPGSNTRPTSIDTSSLGDTGTIAGVGSMTTVKKKGPAVAPKRGARKLKYVEAMYDYEARSRVEHSMKEGERFVLINPDTGDGWADVERDGIIKSVPANYLKEA